MTLHTFYGILAVAALLLVVQVGGIILPAYHAILTTIQLTCAGAA